MKNKDGQQVTARMIANEILADYVDMMLDGGLYKYDAYMTEKDMHKVELQLKKVAKKALKGTGFTNVRLD